MGIPLKVVGSSPTQCVQICCKPDIRTGRGGVSLFQSGKVGMDWHGVCSRMRFEQTFKSEPNISGHCASDNVR
jgi:hypothetical protein